MKLTDKIFDKFKNIIKIKLKLSDEDLDNYDERDIYHALERIDKDHWLEYKRLLMKRNWIC